MPNQFSGLEQAKSTVIDLAIKFGPKVVVAIVVLVAGFHAARWIGMIFNRRLERLHLEPPVRLLLVRVVRLVIIFTRPFRVGDYVSMVGVEGQVETIDLFTTQLSHVDLSVVVVPNRKIVGEILHNYGEIRQPVLSVSIARAADLDRALAAIHEVVKANPEPAPVVGVMALANTSIGIAVRPWVKVLDYVPAGAEINQAIVEKFHAASVDYPMVLREICSVGSPQAAR